MSSLCEVFPGGPTLQESTLNALERLSKKASHAGFKLRVESGFRPFERQLSIWNRKARGELALFDPLGNKLNAPDLSPNERLWAILHWSALPGTSRHHWGSDLDICDALACPAGYEVQLTAAEVAPGGIFGPLHEWLDRQISQGQAEEFYRPYRPGCGKIQPERWHLSHAPTAREFEKYFSKQTLREILVGAQIELLDPILKNLDYILENYTLCYFQSAT